MKHFFKSYSGLMIAALLMLVACSKEKRRMALVSKDIHIPSEIAVQLSADHLDIELDSTNAKSTQALKLSWNLVKGGAGISANYVLQVDSAGGAFTYPLDIPLGEDSVVEMTSKKLNDLAIGMGLTSKEKGVLQVRVKASIKNMKSPLYSDTTIFSDVIRLLIKPYATGVDNTVFPTPDSLYIIGDATPSGNWERDVNADEQGFMKLDNGSFGIIIRLKAGKHYAFIPRNGEADTTYSLEDVQGSADESGEFVLNGLENIPSPKSDGLYKIEVSPVLHTYKVTSVDPAGIPDGLLIVGSVTADMTWGLSTSKKYMTKKNAYLFSVILEVKPGNGNTMLLMDVNNVAWNAKIGIPDASAPDANVSGPFEQGSGVADFPTPDKNGGVYKFSVNYLTHTYRYTSL